MYCISSSIIGPSSLASVTLESNQNYTSVYQLNALHTLTPSIYGQFLGWIRHVQCTAVTAVMDIRGIARLLATHKPLYAYSEIQSIPGVHSTFDYVSDLFCRLSVLASIHLYMTAVRRKKKGLALTSIVLTAVYSLLW
jgi:hypothetical protein